MNVADKNVLFLIALELDLPDILKLCQTHTRANINICQNNNFCIS